MKPDRLLWSDAPVRIEQCDGSVSGHSLVLALNGRRA
jgi:hypothetical protein